MSHQSVVDELVKEHGTTYAEAAGIKLADKPSPLFQLLVLTMLSSTRISADIAVAAARELFKAGWRTPQRMRDATWQQRVDALGRAGYRRYDESTSTKLEQLSQQVLDEYGGDLRRMRPSGPNAADDLAEVIASFPRIGPTGARHLLSRGAGRVAGGRAVLRRAGVEGSGPARTAHGPAAAG